MVVTYENGAKQSVELAQAKTKIAKIEFNPGSAAPGSTGAGGADKPGVYSHGNKKVEVKLGKRAFADRVVDYKPGNPAPGAESANPKCALGEADYDAKSERADMWVSLGKGGSLTLEFTKVAIVDGDGADIYVFEIGPQVEGTVLEISSDGRKWIEIGRISGGTAAVDIAGKAPKGQSFPYVRLTDIYARNTGKQTASGAPGPDIDAVAALNAVPS